MMSWRLLKNEIYSSGASELYKYTVYAGEHQITLKDGESAWYYEQRNTGPWGLSVRNKQKIYSKFCCTVISGYTPPERTAQIIGTNLPYINGCSTENLLPPIRLGDPTMQMLYMPPNTSEQARHIHSTARVVYVLDGRGVSVTDKKTVIRKGDVLVLDKMVPHHFVTGADFLWCSPMHIYSSIGSEKNHPMYNGTYVIDESSTL